MTWKPRYLLFGVAGLFAAGLIDNAVNGTAEPGDTAAQCVITYATRLRSCQIVLSFLILSFRLPSRLIIDGSQSDRGVRTGCSLITFLFGWWGIPFGPIWTLRALSSNMRGANVVSVGEVLEGKSELVVPVATSRR